MTHIVKRAFGLGSGSNLQRLEDSIAAAREVAANADRVQAELDAAREEIEKLTLDLEYEKETSKQYLDGWQNEYKTSTVLYAENKTLRAKLKGVGQEFYDWSQRILQTLNTLTKEAKADIDAGRISPTRGAEIARDEKDAAEVRDILQRLENVQPSAPIVRR